MFFKTPFEFYFYYIFILILLPFFLVKYGVPKFLLQILALPLIVGLFYILVEENLPFTFLKVFGGVFITSLFFYGWIRHFKTDVQLIFKWYCYSCWVLVIIGIFQIFSFFIGFKYGYDFSWLLNKWGFVEGGVIGLRVNSILSEPTYLATALAPVIYVSIHNLISKSTFLFNKFQSILVLMVAILTTSSIGYLGIIISILLCTETIRIRYILFGII